MYIIIKQIKSFDATLPKKIRYEPSLVGNSIKKIHCIVKDIDVFDDTNVYENYFVTKAYSFTILKNSLKNDKEYKMYLRAQDTMGKWSEWSEPMKFNTITPPRISFLPMEGGIVKNQNIDLCLEYDQDFNEMPLEVEYFFNRKVDSTSGKIRDFTETQRFKTQYFPNTLTEGGWIVINKIPASGSLRIDLLRAHGTVDKIQLSTAGITTTSDLAYLLTERISSLGYGFELEKNKVLVRTADKITKLSVINRTGSEIETRDLTMKVPSQLITDLKKGVWYSAAARVKTVNGFEKFYLSPKFQVDYASNKLNCKIELTNNEFYGGIDIYVSQVLLNKTEDEDYPEAIKVIRREVYNPDYFDKIRKEIEDSIHNTPYEKDNYTPRELEIMLRRKRRLATDFLSDMTTYNGITHSSEWEDVAIIEDWDWHSKNKLGYNTDKIDIRDKAVKAKSSYEYALVAVTGGIKQYAENKGDSRVECFYEDVFLSDKDLDYKIRANAQMSNITVNNSNATLLPLNSKAPLVIHGQGSYRTGTITGTIVAEDSLYDINMQKQDLLKQELLSFLNNKRPKILKSLNGEILLVSITNNVELEPTLAQGIFNISFNFTEIGELTSKNLDKAGILVHRKDTLNTIFPENFYA